MIDASRAAPLLVALQLAALSAQAAVAPPHPAEAYGKLPLLFEANRGQTSPQVSYLAYGAGYRLFLTGEGAVLSLRQPAREAVLRLQLQHARPDPAVTAESEQAARSNYFIGSDRAHHVTDVPNYARVRYAAVYPGIDLVYYGNQRQLEYDFVVAPGAHADAIALRFSGAQDVRIDAAGDLVLHTDLGDLRQHRPFIYQDIAGKRSVIEGRYVRRADDSVGIEVAAYDHSQPLVIDPVLSYSTFLGGSGSDYGSAIAIDSSGNAYIAGYTASSDFPTLNAEQRSLGRGATNIFVAKLNAAGSALVYSTYLGGASETDVATGIAVDSAGNAYVTGTTSSSTFPVTTSAYQKGVSGGGSFVAKLGSAGNTLLYSTYLQKASARAIAVDANNNAYVAGAASSGFATTSGAFQTSFRSTTGTNAFAIKLNATGSAASYATLLGGTGTDGARGLALASDGSVVLGGATTSTDFPVLNAYQPSLGGMQDGFIARLNASGTALAYSTYLGGEMDDAVNAIALDAAGNAYAGGETYSFRFPISPFAFLPNKGGQTISQQNGTVSQGNGFVTKLNASGDSLAYSTFLSGSYCYPSWCLLYQPPSELPSDAVYGIAVDAAGHAYATGIVRSPAFPLVDSLVTTDIQALNGQDAMFVTKLSQGGDTALYSTFLRMGPANGGNTPAGLPNDAGKGIALDASGSAYGVGEGLTGFPTTSGAYRTTNAGATDAVIFKLASDNVSMSISMSPNPIVAGQQAHLTATVPGGGSSGTVTFHLSFGDGTARALTPVALVNGSASAVIDTYGGGIIAISATYRNNGANTADTPLQYLVINAAPCN